MKTIAVFGLGKLGLPFLASAASRGFYVYGVDVDRAVLRIVAEKRTPYEEPLLAEYLRKFAENYEVMDDGREAVQRSEMSFILVPTPSTASGSFSTALVEATAPVIGGVLRQKAMKHVVVLSSTVSPGSSERAVIPALERASGRKCGEGFGFCYGPEFVALGSVIRDMFQPPFALIGEHDQDSGAALESFLRAFLPQAPPICRMNIINAEIAKIAVNTFVTTKITYANLLAALCGSEEGGDVDVVTRAIGNDPRIGSLYLKGGMGYGGPCFPRDNKALAAWAAERGILPDVPLAVDSFNRSIPERIVGETRRLAPHALCVAVLGVSYKCGTGVVEESQGLECARLFEKENLSVILSDTPAALSAARVVLGEAVEYETSLEKALLSADVVLIALPDMRYASVPALLKNGGRGVLVVDPWRFLKREDCVKARYWGIGNAR